MAILASDNFNRANNADLGASWDVCTGESSSAGLEIVSNAVDGNKDDIHDASETNNAATWPNDQYSEVTYAATAHNGVGAGIGPTTRAATGATVTYYRLICNADGYELGKKVAGAFTSLSSGSGTTFAAADKARLTNNGTTWSLSKNGGAAFASSTDSSVTAGRAGIAYSSTDAGTTVDAWEGGDLTGGGGASGKPWMHYASMMGQ